MIPVLLARATAATVSASWKPGLLLLSYAVAVAVSFTALDVASRVATNTGLARRMWLVSGATMMGIGIWSMNFLGMLAFRVDMPTSYDGPLTLASMLVAILASAFALLVVSRPTVATLGVLFAGVSIGLLISAMHYLGMAAMRVPARIHYRPLLVTASVLIAVGASVAAGWLAFRLREESTERTWSPRKMLSAVMLGTAITGMHYTGMAAATFEVLPASAETYQPGVEFSEFGAMAIGLAALLGLGLTVVGSLVDLERRRSQRLFELLAEASARMGRSLQPSEILDEFVRVLVPERAGFCYVELKEDDDPRLLRVGAVARVGRPFLEPHALLQNRVRSAGEGDFVDRVIRTGRALILFDVSLQALGEVSGDWQIRRALARAGVRSCLAVPVYIRGEVLGAVVAMARQPRRFGLRDVALFEDLAGRLANALENARLYREAQEAIRVRDEFLTIASHELNTPLTPLLLHLQTLKSTAAASPEGLVPAELVVPKVELAERQQKRLARLVSELLDISRIRVGRLQLHREEFDLAASAREVLARHHPEIERTGSQVSLSAPRPVIGSWDRFRIEQVIGNLLTNAARYGEGEPIDVEVYRDDRTARIAVRDRGIGISPDQQARIFERFERAASLNFGGLGLGLYIVRQIVEAHGGNIRVKSSLGRGSTFIVELPLPETH
ncbi:MAG TPA: MHYT domain-containing protein [Myxococcaceae bacterium]|jgi:signal transduction histidine kinase|nr:MHYT domain-containing protein [Myxococcaceae bacterium]